MDGLDGFIWEDFMGRMGDFVSDEQAEHIIVMRLAGKAMEAADGSDLSYDHFLSDQSVGEDEAEALVDWARGVMVSHALLENVLEGKMVISGVSDGEPEFRLSPKGKSWARSLAEEQGLPLPEGFESDDWGTGAP